MSSLNHHRERYFIELIKIWEKRGIDPDTMSAMFLPMLSFVLVIFMFQRSTSIEIDGGIVHCKPDLNFNECREECKSLWKKKYLKEDCKNCDKTASCQETKRLRCVTTGCGKPPVIPNTTIIGDVFTFGSKLTYKCLSKYEMTKDSQSQISCQRNSTWTKAKLRCELVDCTAAAPTNGAVTSSTVLHGQSTTYSCTTSGYTLIGTATQTCTSGSFSATVPTCEQGWTVFQKRFDGRVDFYRTFKEYEDGFGDVNAEFWMGLKHIHNMTFDNGTVLRIDLTAADGTAVFETYQDFSVSPGPDYTLNIGQAAGTAGDTQGLTDNKGWGFSTKDKDVDGSGGDCAESRHGGWWYNACTYMNLNGDYATPGTQSSYNNGQGGAWYYGFKQYQSLKTTTMMFRQT